MKTVTFCFAVHSHQPAGNFDYVFEDAYRRAYEPFFRLASKYQFHFSAHFSGILLGWLEEHRPEFIEILRSMIADKRLEVISGGYYEPILPVIPERDALEQIRKLNRTIERLFGKHPLGMWTAERVWEQQIVRPISDAGIRYTMLDDTHFRAAGLDETQLNGYYETEHQGRSICVFPISKELRYTIPFRDVDESTRVLRDAADETGNALVTFADDSEKFGVWPETFKHVYTDGWLEEFFAKLDENKSWLQTKRASDVLTSVKPKGRIYLPNASYAEMMQWSLVDADMQNRFEDFSASLQGDLSKFRQFVRGGFWRNFFVKYPEAYHLYRRMLAISASFDSTSQNGYDDLLASQCNDTYWHGVFGGIYLPHLRHSAYMQLIQAESTLYDDSLRVSSDDRVTNIRNKTISVYFDNRYGSITEIDLLPKQFNVMNILNRRKEAYHRKLNTTQTSSDTTRSIHDIVRMKEKDIAKHLLYDPYPHQSMIEHFIGDDMTANDLVKMKIKQCGKIIETQEPVISETDESISIRFISNVEVTSDSIVYPVVVTKTATIRSDGSIDVDHSLVNFSERELRVRFASEWTFGLLSGDSQERYYEANGSKLSGKDHLLRSSGELTDVNVLSLVDDWNGFRIDLSSDSPGTYWRAPIETVASSEDGFERVYQGSVIWHIRPLILLPHIPIVLKIIVNVH